MRLPAALLLLAATAATPVHAQSDGLRVVVDVAPVHSLVARVMGRDPELLIPATASPHDWAMRPAQAAALEAADLVVLTAPDFAPAAERAVASLSGATVVALAGGGEADGGHGDHDHGDHDHAEDDHAEDDHGHDDHGHGEVGHDDHGHDDHHDHASAEAHFWLDPREAAEKALAIAEALAEADPDGAATYRANAAALQADLAAMEGDLVARLAPLRGVPLITAHDAWGLFAERFGLTVAATVGHSLEGDPGAARMAELQGIAATAGCAVAEPQESPRLLMTAIDGAGLPVVEVDPLGAALTPGADLYAALMDDVADALLGCVDG